METMSEHMPLALRVFYLESRTQKKNISCVRPLRVIQTGKHHDDTAYLALSLFYVLLEQILLSKCLSI